MSGYVKRSGVGIESDCWGRTVVVETFTCLHCQRIVEITNRHDPNAVNICRMCYGMICPQCANRPCEHWEARLERFEREHALDHDRLINMIGEAERAAARFV